MAAAATEPHIVAAFKELRDKHRILVEENCACCGNCAHAECTRLMDEAKDEKVGYLFFHAQDLEAAAECGELWLGHRARDGMPERVVPLVACSVLADHGLQTEWDGDVQVRIKVELPDGGPDRAYFQRMLEEAWATDADEDSEEDSDGDDEEMDGEAEEEGREAEAEAGGQQSKPGGTAGAAAGGAGGGAS